MSSSFLECLRTALRLPAAVPANWTTATRRSLVSSISTKTAPAPSNFAPKADKETPKRFVEPRASNPVAFQKLFFDPEKYHQVKKNEPAVNNNRMPGRIPFRQRDATSPKQPHRPPWPSPLAGVADSRCQTLGDHLRAQGEAVAPSSKWVQVEGISPISSLEAMLAGIHKALDKEEARGMVNLDALWSAGEPIPVFCIPQRGDLGETTETGKNKWVRKAKVILSPFGRPTGWYLQFDNRSVVYALLRYALETPIHCAWKGVTIQEYKSIAAGSSDDPVNHGNFIMNKRVSDYTLRVENCPQSIRETTLLNFFSRYDLQPGEDAVQQWQGITSDGKRCPPTTYLVHFADASWARAALREKQAAFIYRFGARIVPDEKNPQPLRLVQFPRQML